LKDSDAEKVVSLYTAGGVLLANSAPTAVGIEQVSATYKYVFDNFTYNLKFTIDEIRRKRELCIRQIHFKRFVYH
jgi:ketosteroid isomerase-like protein